MTLRPVPIEDFGGLDLRSAPTESRGAIDLLNVAFDQPGVVRTRNGSGVFTTAPAAGPIRSMDVWYSTAGAVDTFYTDGVNLVALNGVGAQIATTPYTGVRPAYVSVGTPTAERLYVVGDWQHTQRWDGVTFTDLLIPAGKAAALQTADNRLVIANTSATTRSTVNFSDAGAPETWQVNNFVSLTPGDGEEILALISWRELLFAFKRTKFFVFYGNSNDVAGQPVFNYRPVVGVGLEAPKALCAARDGVYFLSQTGIYRTSGGVAELVSSPLDPLFTGQLSPFSRLEAINKSTWTDAQFATVNERVYASVPLGANSVMHVLCFDPRYQWWTVNQFAGANTAILPLATQRVFPEDEEQLLFGAASAGGQHILRHNATFTSDDAGTAITSRYRAAFSDFGIPAEKSIRETLLEGIGSPLFQWSRDWGDLDEGQTVTLGSSPAIAPGRSRRATRGRFLSWQISGTQPWALEQLAPQIRSNRHSGVQTHA